MNKYFNISFSSIIQWLCLVQFRLFKKLPGTFKASQKTSVFLFLGECRNIGGHGSLDSRNRRQKEREKQQKSRGRAEKRKSWREDGWKSNGIMEAAGGRWFGVEISFYGRVTNLRTRHCRVPGDGRTMRVRDTMLHSGIWRQSWLSTCNHPSHLCLPILAPLAHTTLLLPTASSLTPAPRERPYFLILSSLLLVEAQPKKPYSFVIFDFGGVVTKRVL